MRKPSGRSARNPAAREREGAAATNDRERRERPAPAQAKGAARRVRKHFAVTSDRPARNFKQRERRRDGCLPLSQPACRSGSDVYHGGWRHAASRPSGQNIEIEFRGLFPQKVCPLVFRDTNPRMTHSGGKITWPVRYTTAFAQDRDPRRAELLSIEV